MNNVIIFFMLLAHYAYANDNYYYQNNKKIEITAYVFALNNNLNATFYENEKGIRLGISNKLLVKLKTNTNINKYLKEFNLILEKTLGTRLYLLKSKNKKLTLDISNRLNEKDDVEFAHPDFLRKIKRR